MLKPLLLIFLIVIPSIYEFFRRSTELDYLHTIPLGTLTMNFSDFLSEKHPIEIRENILYFNRRQIFRGNHTNFITLLSSKANIKPNDGGLYEVNDKPQKICTKQILSSIKEIQNEVTLQGKFDDCQNSQYLLILTIKQKELLINLKLRQNNFNRIKLSFEHSPESHYFGLGQQFSYLDLGNNRPYSMFVREKGIGRTEQPQTTLVNLLHKAGGSYFTSYCPSPIWLSTRKIGYLLDSYAYAAWMNNQMLVWDRNITFHLFFGDTLKQILSQISEINGYTKPIPDWVNEGAILGLQGNAQTVIQKYKKIEEKGGIVKGLWLQDWVGKRFTLGYSRLWWNWELDHSQYKDWDQMKEKLEKEDVKLLIYMNPMFSDASQKEKVRRHMYKEGKQNNHFIKENNGKFFQATSFSDYTSTFIDFDKEQSKQFYQDIVSDAIKSTGSSGMMVDFSQGYPVQNKHSSIEEAIKFHNMYPVKYHQSTKEVFDSLPNESEIYTFARAGYLRAPKYTHSLWAGDQQMNFKKHTGLSSCLTAILSSGLVGYSSTHCDIGGYIFYKILFHPTSDRSQILLQRWIQFSAFTPVFRSHEGNAPDKTLQIYSNEKFSHIFAFYSNIYAALAKYRKSQIKSSFEQKIPLMRALFLEHEEDVQTYTISDQYYLGNDILVSPLLTEEKVRKLYIPEGKWVDIWTGSQMEGCNCWITKQFDWPPVYIKENSSYKNEILKKIKEIVEKYGQAQSIKEEEL